MDLFSIIALGIGILFFVGLVFFIVQLKFLKSQATEKNVFLDNPYYSIENNQVVYSGDYPVLADAKKFLPLDSIHPLGKDEYVAFYKDKEITGAFAPNFTIIQQAKSLYYSTDGEKIFINQYYMKGADPKNFIVYKGTQFSRDENTVFYQGKPVKGAHSLTFQALEGDYGRDKDHYFLRRTMVDISTVPHNVFNDSSLTI